jgi:hypothetical protein
MGWGRTLLLGVFGNRLDIEDAEHDIACLKREIAGSFRKDMSQDEIIHHLMTENAQLKLYFASLVRLLIRKGSISKDELAAIVAVVDAEDGSADGRFDGEIV